MSAEGAAERSARVLVVDDEPQMRAALCSVFRAHRWTVDLAVDGEAGLEAAATNTPDVVVLDLTLPGISGFDVVRELRGWYPGPIIVLSVLGSEADKVKALDLGADDYLTKPFLAGELTARIRALLRRATPGDTLREVVSGDLVVDLVRRAATVSGEMVHLTRTEFDILALLARNADRVVTSRMILEQVWGPEYVGDTQTLRAHMSHLRHKIERSGDVSRHILTEPGVGFRFVSAPS